MRSKRPKLVPDWHDKVRLFEHVSIIDGCWVIHNIEKNGYGKISLCGKKIWAHRASYEMYRGPIPKGFDLDHLCRNPACVNPEHLEIVTRQQNVNRGNGRRKVFCKRGHLMFGANLYMRPDRSGHRECLACIRYRTVRNWKELNMGRNHE